MPIPFLSNFLNSIVLRELPWSTTILVFKIANSKQFPYVFSFSLVWNKHKETTFFTIFAFSWQKTCSILTNLSLIEELISQIISYMEKTSYHNIILLWKTKNIYVIHKKYMRTMRSPPLQITTAWSTCLNFSTKTYMIRFTQLLFSKTNLSSTDPKYMFI